MASMLLYVHLNPRRINAHSYDALARDCNLVQHPMSVATAHQTGALNMAGALVRGIGLFVLTQIHISRVIPCSTADPL
jgi:hypothetical protein